MPHSIPNVLVRHDPIGDPLPIMFDSPHSGVISPEDFRHALARILKHADD